jgi:hypothetical protein
LQRKIFDLFISADASEWPMDTDAIWLMIRPTMVDDILGTISALNEFLESVNTHQTANAARSTKKYCVEGRLSFIFRVSAFGHIYRLGCS